MERKLPSVSVLIPTLNSAKTLRACLGAIAGQQYPKPLIEVIVADGGSLDDTVAIAHEFGARVVPNPLRTGESGKAVALREATRELVALIDSDNILVGNDWVLRMVAPFVDDAIIGSEPLSFVSEPGDSLVDRYCALAGVNDPLCLFMGNYDKYSCFSGRWTDLPIAVIDRGDFFDFALSGALPTIGANGTLYRRTALKTIQGDYFMDIDVPVLLAKANSGARFAKVRTAIRHLFCGSVGQFRLKQTRRIRDFFAKEHRDQVERLYPWHLYVRRGALRFVASTVTIVPLLVASMSAFARTRERAAFFHIVACWITLYVYAVNVLFARGKSFSRDHWQLSSPKGMKL